MDARERAYDPPIHPFARIFTIAARLRLSLSAFEPSGHRPYRRRHESPAVQWFSWRTHTGSGRGEQMFGAGQQVPGRGQSD